MRTKTIALAGVTFAAALLLAIQEYLSRGWSGGSLSFDGMLFGQIVSAAVWSALIPALVLPLSRRFPVEPRDGRNAVVHVIAALTVPLLQMAIVGAVLGSYYFGWAPRAYYDILRDKIHTGYAWGIVVYALVIAAIYVRGRVSRVAEPVAAAAQTEPYVRRILVKQDGRVGVVPVEQVDWLEANDNYVTVHTGAAKHSLRGTLAELADKLDPRAFVRVHRSTIVNVDRVREVQPWFQGEQVLILADQTRLRIGRTYREQLLNALER